MHTTWAGNCGPARLMLMREQAVIYNVSSPSGANIQIYVNKRNDVHPMPTMRPNPDAHAAGVLASKYSRKGNEGCEKGLPNRLHNFFTFTTVPERCRKPVKHCHFKLRTPRLFEHI